MSLENGKCPSCGGALLLDSSKEKMVCKFCGHEVVIQQAVQKVKVDGIADFDTQLIKAQHSLEIDQDFDKAAKYYRAALELRPDDFRALWGAFLCEIAGIYYAQNSKGYVQVPGDLPQNFSEAMRRYGQRAYDNAPDDVKPYYYGELQKVEKDLKDAEEAAKKKKKGCYIATCVYGSYDCPEVWVLRRYRDEDLDNNWFGRRFISIYYALSPTIVRLFGKTKWFNAFWRKRLDKKVSKLKEKGYQDTPYSDQD